MKNRAKSGKMGDVMAKAMADEAFKQKLIDQPRATLAEEGIEVPAGLEIRVVEDTDRLLHLVLPDKSAAGKLSEADLVAMAGGTMDTRQCRQYRHDGGYSM